MHPLLHLGPILVPTYYLLISAGSLAGIIWFLRRTPQEEESLAINFALMSLIAGFAGARLLHIFFEAPQIYAEDPWLALEIWQGGFVFYGGLLAALLAAYFYGNHRGVNFPVWLDRASLPAGLAYAIGRVGCFFNGCCYGKVCSLSWAVRFPVHAAWGMAVLPRHPTQLYASGLESVNLLLLLVLERQKIFKHPGQLFWCWLSLHAVNRMIMEHFRDDDRGAFIFGMSISSLISLVLLAIAIRQLTRYRSCKSSQ